MRADTDLVTAAQSGDTEALDALLRRHYDRVYALCRRLAGNESDALDATQEALIAVVRGLPRFDGRAAFTTWMYRVATNACLDELRRRRRRPDPHPTDDEADAGTDGPRRSTRPLPIDSPSTKPSPGWPRTSGSPSCCATSSDSTTPTIATALDIPPGTVRSRIARGRADLARRLGNPSADASVGTEAP